MATLSESYYAACNEVFRRATNQSSLMLGEFEALCRGRDRLGILSVGSGAGLFEIPMLMRLRKGGHEISRFVGVDINGHACAQLTEKLDVEFGESLAFDVVCAPFQDFIPNGLFDIVLYNHAFEYLGDHPLTWIRKSQTLLAPSGNIVIFSPNRGGINRIYAEVMTEQDGSPPFFSDDIEATLTTNQILFWNKIIRGECDVSLLEAIDDPPDKVRLLSFLTQRDCRAVTAEESRRYVDYYLSLRSPNGHTIPHPTTMFIVAG